MPKLTVLKQDGTEAGQVELNDSVFGIEPNSHVVHEAVVMQRAAKRQGTHAVKNRSAVSGGGAKPWRQKGTGRARQGSTRSPQWVGGGVVFGPRTERNYKAKLPKKVRQLAMKSALSSKVQSDSIIVLEELQFDAPKTKDILNVIDKIEAGKKVLFVTADKNDYAIRSANNLKTVQVLSVNEISVLDIVSHDKVVFTKAAAEKTGEVLA